jgi:small subunit ribosomal protein S18
MATKKIPQVIVPIEDINWKSITLLQHYITRFGNIKPRKYTGNNVSFQKATRQAIIRARELGLIPYIR